MICAAILIFSSVCRNHKKNEGRAKPNIVIFYADDIGYGDVGCYGAREVKTPNIDALAENGMRFTYAHINAATCMLSRYSLLTDRYAIGKKARALEDVYQDQAVELLGDHKPVGPLSGGEYSAFEAGTRVPFITHWPGVIQPAVSDSLMGQMDLFASFAALTHQEVESGAALDSQNFMDTLLGISSSEREYLLEESYSFSLRYNSRKYIQPHKDVPLVDTVNIEGDYQLELQLYDLLSDIGEQINLAKRILKCFRYYLIN